MEKLNQRLSIRSALFTVVAAALIILASAAVARACAPTSQPGCDTGCAVQIVNTCAEPNSCVVRSCECETTNPPIFAPCGGCIFTPLGYSGLKECCLTNPQQCL